MPPEDYIQYTRLENTSGSHNKFYEIWIVHASGGYDVRFQYGRIGTSGVGGVKRAGLALSTAHAVFNNLKFSKMNKGYQQVKTSSGPKKGKPVLMVKSPSFVDVLDSPKKSKPKKVKKKAAKKKDDDPPKRSILV